MAGIEGIAESVAEEIETQYGDEDGETGKKGQPPRAGEQLPLAVLQHVPPRRRGNDDAEPEVAQARLQDDRIRKPERRFDDDDGEAVRQKMAGHDPGRIRADRAGRGDELLTFQRQKLTPDKARRARPRGQTDDDDGGFQAR